MFCFKKAFDSAFDVGESRGFDGFFGEYQTAIRRLAKKIGCRQKVNFSQKNKNLRHSIFLASLRIAV
jgi:hypothetical protein